MGGFRRGFEVGFAKYIEFTMGSAKWRLLATDLVAVGDMNQAVILCPKNTGFGPFTSQETHDTYFFVSFYQKDLTHLENPCSIMALLCVWIVRSYWFNISC